MHEARRGVPALGSRDRSTGPSAPSPPSHENRGPDLRISIPTRISSVLTLVIVVFLASCSTSRHFKDVENDYTGPLDAFDVGIVVESDHPEEAGAIAEVRAGIIDHLIGAGLFREVVSHADAEDVELHVQLRDVREASGGTRIRWGWWAGENHIHADVVLRRRSTDEVLRSCYLEASSASHPMSGCSDMSDAVGELAKAVVAFLSGGAAGTEPAEDSTT